VVEVVVMSPVPSLAPVIEKSKLIPVAAVAELVEVIEASLS
tara:strand:+ start:1121 stop:1243 length:123 start_codon:yes stop_codon:yes gene_type:complete